MKCFVGCWVMSVRCWWSALLGVRCLLLSIKVYLLVYQRSTHNYKYHWFSHSSLGLPSFGGVRGGHSSLGLPSFGGAGGGPLYPPILLSFFFALLCSRTRPSPFENMPFLGQEEALLEARRACSRTLSVMCWFLGGYKLDARGYYTLVLMVSCLIRCNDFLWFYEALETGKELKRWAMGEVDRVRGEARHIISREGCSM